MSAIRHQLPPLNALKAFEAAARHLSFSEAAAELQVTPGAISQQIRQLEEYAGTPLFKRTGRQVLLTDTGKAALPLIIDAFGKLVEAGRTIRAPARKGKVMISCAPSFAVKWLAPRLDAFHQSYPDIEAWISADMELTDFARTETDLAIRYGRGAYDGLIAEKLLEETALPVCSPRLLSGSKAINTPADLMQHTLIHDESGEKDPSCPDWASWLRARKVKGQNTLKGPRYNQAAMVIEAALAGQGVALAKKAIAAADLASGRLVAPFADGGSLLDFSYWLVWPRGRTQSIEARTFVKWAKAEASAAEVVGV